MKNNAPAVDNLRKILCPTDLSEESEAAIGFAADLADTLNAGLFVCHSLTHHWWTSEKHLAAETEKLNKIISTSLEKHCRCANSLKWQGLIFEDNSEPAAAAISAFASESGCDLIVMGARKRPLAAHLLGSTTERVVQTAPCPVLLLPHDYLGNKKNSGAKPEFRRILVNYDFTSEAEEILVYALWLAKSFKTEVHLLHVLPNSGKMTTELSSNSDGQKILEKLLLEKMREAVPEEMRDSTRIVNVVRVGDWQNELLDYTKNTQVDLVCTPVPKPKFLLDTIFPLQLGHLLRYSVCPVMVRRPRAKQMPAKTPAREINVASPLV